jgi:hypothetical protein
MRAWNEADFIRIKHTKEDMMSLHRNLLAVAVAGALTAAAAVPALALENEFHGTFVTLFDNSDFNGVKSAFGFYDPTGPKSAPTANFIEQRVRLAYIGKANENVKLVTKFEIDYQTWGNSSYFVKRNGGGALGADGINFETKSAYLDLNLPSCKLNAKLGMQPFDDAFKGIFVGADMAGLLLSRNYDKASASAGFFRWDSDSADKSTPFGKNARDFFVLDGKVDLTKNLKVGAAYYLVNSDNVDILHDNTTGFGGGTPLVEDVIVHMLGVNAAATFGPLTVDGFFAYQFGNDRATVSKAFSNHISAYAANVGARMKVGKGTARSEFLYVSGEGNVGRNSTSNAFFAPQSAAGAESGFYNSESVILSRDKYAMTNDKAIIYDVNNKNQGVILGSIGYDQVFSEKLVASANLGFAAVAKDNTSKPVNLKIGGANTSNYLGTEVNAEAAYKLFESVTLIARAGYVFLGDYYKDTAVGGTPDNPYDAKLIVNYSF